MYLSAFVFLALGFAFGFLYGRLRRPTPPPANVAPQVVTMIVGPITQQR